MHSRIHNPPSLPPNTCSPTRGSASSGGRPLSGSPSTHSRDGEVVGPGPQDVGVTWLLGGQIGVRGEEGARARGRLTAHTARVHRCLQRTGLRRGGEGWERGKKVEEWG